MIEIQPDKIIEKITNKKTGEKYKNDAESSYIKAFISVLPPLTFAACIFCTIALDSAGTV